MKLANYFDAYITAILKAKLRAYFNAKDLKFLRRGAGLLSAKYVVIALVRNEASRLTFFLQYYRSMGFQHFIIIDNLSTDDTLDLLRKERDVTIISSTGSFKKSRFGMDWVNFIASRYCKNKWLLHVDADEFLVFPKRFSGRISKLTGLFNESCQFSMQSMMIDMYSKNAPSENYCARGEDPLSICSLFDEAGYATSYNQITQTTWIKGGVRARIFFNKINEAPALNKTPLVFWKWHYAFIKCAHEVWPPHINGGRHSNSIRIGGALLHFKFLADFDSKISEEVQRQQHTGEYGSYSNKSSAFIATSLPCRVTKHYESFESLEESGLVGSFSK